MNVKIKEGKRALESLIYCKPLDFFFSISIVCAWRGRHFFASAPGDALRFDICRCTYKQKVEHGKLAQRDFKISLWGNFLGRSGYFDREET